MAALLPKISAPDLALRGPRELKELAYALNDMRCTNFGSVLIVFDRLSGTFANAPKDEQLRFGVVSAEPAANPLKIVFGVWREMFADAYRAARATAKLL